MRNKRKIMAMVTAGVLAAAIALTGTFAWVSISQVARNEMIRSINPGGRLHDDFNGMNGNKDIYVENFMDGNKGGLPIYARIRLYEYMEIGADAGQKLGVPGRQATPVVPGSDINNVTTWAVHIPQTDHPEKCGGGSVPKGLHEYWTWELGGETVYMPTFNRNKDSLAADINGSLAEQFNDYHKYEEGETKTDPTYYDADDNIDDEDKTKPGNGGRLGENYTEEIETHTAKKTSYSAQVLTMAQWKALGAPRGPYWVYDTDGWAYWAQAIDPGETTGLLMDGLRFSDMLDENCYYSINVVGQFATQDDWGSETDREGFYRDDAGGKPSADALFLLKQAAGLEYTVSVAPAGLDDSDVVPPGESARFQATADCGGTERVLENVTWTVSGDFDLAPGTRISKSGVLEVGADETNPMLLVQAKAWNEVVGECTVLVNGAAGASLLGLDPEETVDPEITDPEVTVDPEATIDPEATVDPETTVEPVVTVDPETTAAPETTADPEITADPEVTESPETTVTPEVVEPTPSLTGEPEPSQTAGTEPTPKPAAPSAPEIVEPTTELTGEPEPAPAAPSAPEVVEPTPELTDGPMPAPAPEVTPAPVG